MTAVPDAVPSPPDVTIEIWPAGSDRPPLPAATAPPTRIWYLGDDRRRLERLRDILSPPHRPADVGDAVNEAAVRAAAAVADLDDRLGLDERYRDAWDAGDLADRSPYVTPLILEAARGLACLDASRDGGRHLFLCDDAEMAAALTATLRRNGRPVRGPRPPTLVERISGSLAGAITAVAARRRAAAAVLAAARALRRLRRARPVDWENIRRADIIVATWASSLTFTTLAAGGDDAYLGALPRALLGTGSRVAFLAIPMDWVEPFPAIAERTLAASPPAVLPQDAITLGAAARASWASWTRPLAKTPEWRIDGDDLGPMAARAAALDHRRGRAFQATLFGGIGEWLARRGCRPRVLLVPYENQAWEKTLRRGFRRHLPDCRVVGVQHAPFAPVYASFLPSPRELAEGGTPDLLITTGADAERRFIARGWPPERLLRGALRFPALAAAALASSPPRSADRSPAGKVVCATGVGIDEATELAIKAALATGGPEAPSLVVNFHPTVDDMFKVEVREAVRAATNGNDGHVVYSDDPVRMLVRDADALLYNASGSVFDALAVGCPPLFVGRELVLDIDKAAVAGGGGSPVRRVEALREALAALPGMVDGRAILADRFASVDIDELTNAIRTPVPRWSVRSPR